jgi:photosystem II stability/assembly factor-like uncharacterized protein
MRARITSWTAVTFALVIMTAASALAGAAPSLAAADAPAGSGIGGAQVQTITAPLGTARADANPTLSGVTCVSPGTAWVCGLNAAIYRTTNGGVSWTKLSSSPMPADEEVTDIEFVSPTTGWAIGSANAIMRSTNGGSGWSSQSFLASLYPPTLLDVSAVDATHAWIGGYYKTGGSYYHNVVLRTTNGTDWQMSANLMADGATDWGVTGIDFPDQSHGWASISGGYYAYCNDGGAVWSPPIDVTGASYFNDVSFGDATHGWVVGQDSSYNGFIMHTSNGVDWYRQAQGISGLDPLPEVRAVCAVDQNVAWVACAGGYVLQTTDGGETWAARDRLVQTDLNAIAATSEVCYVAGDAGQVIRYGDPYTPPAKPVLSALKPASGRVRSTVTLSGHGFGASRGQSLVKFGVKKAPVKSWSDTQIKVTVPSGVPKGYVKVKVTTAGGVSGAKKFLRK